MKVTPMIKITYYLGVGLELLHITLLFTGEDHISLTANEFYIFACNCSDIFYFIDYFIKATENHESGILIRLYIGRFPGGVRPKYPSIDGREMVS